MRELRCGDILRNHGSISNDCMPVWKLLHRRLYRDWDMCRGSVFKCFIEPMYKLHSGSVFECYSQPMYQLRGGY